MAKIQPIRDVAIEDPKALRQRLNEVISRLNESSARVASRRIPNVQTGMPIVTAGPGFSVGGITIGGVKATGGNAAPSAPWIDDWVQLPDGQLKFTVGGLAAAPALYAVNVIFFESEGTS